MSRHHHHRHSLKHRIRQFFRKPTAWDIHRSEIEAKDARKAFLIIGIALLGFAVGTFWIYHWEDEKFTVDSEIRHKTPASTPQAQVLCFEDSVYYPKENIESILFMGIDVEGPAKPTDGTTSGGQCDVVMLLVVDHDARTWQMLQINRDTMTTVPVIDEKGTVLNTYTAQLALAHGYGDGHKHSCQNVVNTVSNLLQGSKIDGYYSMNLDGIAVLNDAVGGVEVTITSDFSEVDPSLVLGETITLQGSQAETFVRSRRNVDDQSNISRMSRQRQYLTSLFSKFSQLDDETVIKAFDQVHIYTVTDMGSKTITDLVETLREYSQLELLTIDGESKVENGWRAFYLDETSLQNTVLQLFYTTKD